MQVLNGHLQAMRREPFWGEDVQEKEFFHALQEFTKQRLDQTVKVRMQVYPCEGLRFVSKPATKCFPKKRQCWVAWSGGSVGVWEVICSQRAPVTGHGPLQNRHL